jgi:hypothetical protein
VALYRRLLGERFGQLHPILCRFHDSPCGGSGAGRFQVVRACGGIRGLLARLLRLPPAGDAVPVQLIVTPRGRGERWSRYFGPHPLITRQTEWRGLLLESAGPLHFGLEVAVNNGGMTFQTRRVWLLGVSLPRACAPDIEAEVVPDESGWAASVTVCLPVLGRLIRYQGRVIPQ